MAFNNRVHRQDLVRGLLQVMLALFRSSPISIPISIRGILLGALLGLPMTSYGQTSDGIAIPLTPLKPPPIVALQGQSVKKTIASKEISRLGLDVILSFVELEKIINEAVKDLLYVDNRFENNDNDNLILEVYKNQDFTVESLSPEQSILRVTAPIKIKALYKLDHAVELSFLWWDHTVKIKNHQALNFDIVVTIDIKISIDKDLKVQVENDISFVWVTYPYVSFYYIFKFRISDQIEAIVQEQMNNELNKAIGLIFEKIDLYKIISNIQKDIFTDPFAIDKESGLWTLMRHVSTGIHGISMNETGIIIRTDNRVKLDILWDKAAGKQLLSEDPNKNLLYPKPRRRLVTKNEFEIRTPVRIGNLVLQNLVIEHLAKNPLFIAQGKDTVHLREIYIQIIQNQLIVDAYLNTVSRNETFQIVMNVQAEPVYAPLTESIELRKLDYTLTSESYIISLISAANKETLKQEIVNRVRLPVADLAETIKATARESLASVFVEGLGLMSVDVTDVVIEDVFIEDDYFVVLLYLRGKAEAFIQASDLQFLTRSAAGLLFSLPK